MPDHREDRRSPVIVSALILTAAFLSLFVVLLSLGDRPAGCPQGAWLLDRLACLEPNALGDTFAGAFAPVAFVWLVAAVLLQRNELAAQRQELRESREVAEAQVVEARNNVAFMEQQTTLLQAREKFERKEKLDEEFKSYVEALNDFIEVAFHSILIATHLDDGLGTEGDYAIVPLIPSDHADILKRLQKYSAKFVECSIEAHRAVELGQTVRYRGVEELKSIRDHLQVLSKRSDTVSDPLQIRFQIVKSDDAIWRIEALISLLKAKGEAIKPIDW